MSLNPQQFSGTYIPGPEGPIRDLTSRRIGTGNRASERASVYRDARDAYDGSMEKVAIGYSTEEREYRQSNPPPSWKSFLREGY